MKANLQKLIGTAVLGLALTQRASLRGLAAIR